MINRLRELRKIHDLTQEDLAKKVGVTRQTINSIEKEKYSPSLDLAFKIAGVFGVKIENIFLFSEEEPFSIG